MDVYHLHDHSFTFQLVDPLCTQIWSSMAHQARSSCRRKDVEYKHANRFITSLDIIQLKSTLCTVLCGNYCSYELINTYNHLLFEDQELVFIRDEQIALL